MSYLEWNAPDQPTYFTYNDAGDIVGYHGSGVNGYVKCPIHGYYPTTYGAPNNAWTIRCKCPKCLEAELLQKKLNAAAIPRRFLDRSLSTFEVTKDWQRVPYETIKGYIDHLEENFERGRCIVMCGLPGTGKTHLAISVALDAISRGKTAVYVTVSDLIARIRDTWGSGKTIDTIDLYASVDLLILDEVGVQAGTENEKNILFDVLNRRYGEMLPSIILSNLNQRDVARYLGQRTWDRLRENEGICLNFNGDSYRKTAKFKRSATSIRQMQVPSADELGYQPIVIDLDDRMLDPDEIVF